MRKSGSSATIGPLRRMLATNRAGDSAPDAIDEARTPFEADVDRLAFDGHMRLLGDKTQVHRAGEGTTARSRLSHSLEVSRVGRSIGAGFVRGTDEAAADSRLSADVQDVLQAAGLLHDIGNTPFGHMGEHALSAFFATHPIGRAALTNTTAADAWEFTHFDGNAQGMRHATRVGGWHPEHGLRLTAATACASAKYPWTGSARTTKRSIFASGAAAYGRAAALCGVAALGATSWRRHPLSYLCEAADDITYSIVDLEDAAMLGIIGYDEAETLMLQVTGATKTPALDGLARQQPGRRVAYLRSQAISALVAEAAQAARDNRDAIMAGELGTRLTMAMPSASALSDIGTFSERRIYPGADSRAVASASWAIGVVAAHAANRWMSGTLPRTVAGPTGAAHAICDLVAGLTDGSCIALATAINSTGSASSSSSSKPDHFEPAETPAAAGAKGGVRGGSQARPTFEQFDAIIMQAPQQRRA